VSDVSKLSAMRVLHGDDAVREASVRKRSSVSIAPGSRL
jgi:hypothetical protein